LAILVNQSGEEEVIEMSEKYLNSLLQIEAFIKLLRKEIASYDRSFLLEAQHVNGELTSNRKRITAQVLHLQKDFYLIRGDLIAQLSQRA
jgi:hypothetical protein